MIKVIKIALTGTPGCGKTTISRKLAKKTGFNLLELNKFVKKEKLYSSYDRKRKTYVVHMGKVRSFLKKKTKKGDWIIDSHISHYLPVDKVIVLRCRPKILEKRLKKKKWGRAKIQENLEAELIGLISYEARKLHKEVYDIDVSKSYQLNLIAKLLKSNSEKKYRKPIDWCAYA